MTATVHRNLSGSWSECNAPACGLKFHLSGMSVAEVYQLPQPALLSLLEAIDPPTKLMPDGEKAWFRPADPDHGRVFDWLHRDYDLPAVIYPDGMQQWWQDNALSRAGGKPAVIYPDGGLEWWYQGSRRDEQGNPRPYVTPRFPRGLR